MSKLVSFAALAAAHLGRFEQSSIVTLQASGTAPDPDFGGEKLDELQAAGVMGYGGTGGKTRNVKALSHFLIKGETVTAGTVVQDFPEEDFKRMGPDGTGQVALATAEEVAAAQKASKK